PTPRPRLPHSLLLPYTTLFRSDLTPGVPVKLDFALYPMSNYVRKGHRLRIAINNFDRGAGWDTPETTPAPTVSVYHNAQYPSSIDRKSTRLNSSHLGISYAVFC